MEFMRIGESAGPKEESNAAAVDTMRICEPTSPKMAQIKPINNNAGNSLKRLRNSAKNAQSNAKGHSFEQDILAGCVEYKNEDKAVIDKTPEPFRVMRKNGDGIFTGRFVSSAQPDFQGTIKGGRSVVFEAKATTKDRIQRRVLTDTQMETLEKHEKAGAFCGVCVCIGTEFDAFFIPWSVWRDMKSIYGRQYIMPKDVEAYRVRYDNKVHFLDTIFAA